jgi:hypothetical protein
MSNKAPGLDEYEKSEFLTKAQDELVKAYFNPKGNKLQEGFDDSEKRQMDFSMLLRTKNITANSNTTDGSVATMFGTTSGVYKIQTNTSTDRIMMILNETIKITNESNSRYLTVVPLKYTELARLMSKPYKRPIKNQAWRIINSGESLDSDNPEDGVIDTTNLTMEIIAHPGDTGSLNYAIRYIKRPRAIRTTTFDEGVTIDGSNAEQGCELDPILHEEIVQRAVELAKAAYAGDVNTQIIVGSASATDKGIIQNRQ